MYTNFKLVFSHCFKHPNNNTLRMNRPYFHSVVIVVIVISVNNW